jgi:inosine-uridine nucleoside N-ribohydrolase
MAGTALAKEKVILDSDMVELFDDGIAMMMLANHPDIDLLGVTVVTGNQWLQDGLSAGVRQLELAGLQSVPIIAGARQPMRSGRYEAVAPPSLTGLDWSGYERDLMGMGTSAYAGEFSSWGHREPGSPNATVDAWKSVYSANYGSAPVKDILRDARPGYAGKNQPAVGADFIIEQVRENPREVTIVAIGPCTNLQIAAVQAPDIIPLVKRVIYMGGAINVSGNTSPAGEFNWWFDPEAAKYAVRAPWGKNDPAEEKITQYIVPLDACEKLYFTPKEYNKIVNLPGIPEGIRAMFEKNYGGNYAAPSSDAESYVWDAITAGLLIGWLNENGDERGDEISGGIILPKTKDDPHDDQRTGYFDWWVDVDADYSNDYGRSLGYMSMGPAGTQKVRIINTVNGNKFWKTVFAGLDTTYDVHAFDSDYD